MKNKSKLLFLLPVIALSSCGYRVPDLVDGDMYNSPIFEKNFYREHDNKLVNAKQGQAVTLDDDKDKVIFNFEELKKLDPTASTVHEYTPTQYGEHYNLSSVDASFKYGYLSKLYNGAMVCGGRYQLSRVQIDTNGFSQKFIKESSNSKALDYFALSFRASTDNPNPCYAKVGQPEKAKHADSELFHNSTVTLTVSIYTKNDKEEIVKNDFTHDVAFDNSSTNRGSGTWSKDTYRFYAFSLANYNLTRVCGIGMTYTYNDELVQYNNEKGVNMLYSLMLYEVFFPYSEWN